VRRAGIVIRPATLADYDAFSRLHPELGVDDPLPSLAAWTSAYVPFTRVALDGAGPDVLGYCYTQELSDAGYVRNIVVAPAARRRGVGRALMTAAAHHLRARGKTTWRLNVAPRNVVAIALYQSLGLRTLYASSAVRIPWETAAALPPSSARVAELPPARDAEVETRFALPRGQLAAARAAGRLILTASNDGASELVALAVFSPAFPGAFPFRALDRAATRPLLEAMRPHVVGHAHVNLVIDDDEALTHALVAAGAEVRGVFLHLAGPLSPSV
jgi:ribosomal protein S18 acetylase RimI-like enzyme